jgi:hypothetical protein
MQRTALEDDGGRGERRRPADHCGEWRAATGGGAAGAAHRWGVILRGSAGGRWRGTWVRGLRRALLQ